MIRGLYSSASGMLAAQTESEIIADNVANVKTPGYKEEEGSAISFPNLLIDRIGGSSGQASGGPAAPVPIGSMGTGVMLNRITRLDTQGAVQTTGISTDLALTTPGLFAVQTPDGERYTRNGHFQLSPDGQLETPDGNLVLGDNGPLGPLSPDFQVAGDGTVLDKGKTVGHLRIVTLPVNALQRVGASLYSSTQAPRVVQSIQVKQGALEASGVDAAGQMVQMITVMRAYEANQKVIQTEDSMLDKSVNEVGKV